MYTTRSSELLFTSKKVLENGHRSTLPGRRSRDGFFTKNNIANLDGLKKPPEVYINNPCEDAAVATGVLTRDMKREAVCRRRNAFIYNYYVLLRVANFRVLWEIDFQTPRVLLRDFQTPRDVRKTDLYYDTILEFLSISDKPHARPAPIGSHL